MDQTPIVIDQTLPAFDVQAISRRLRVQPGRTRILDRLTKLAEEAAAIARPRAGAKLCGLTFLEDDHLRMENVVFTSPLLRRNMGTLGRAFPYLATEGAELAAWALSFTSSSDRIFANAFREAAVKEQQAVLEKTLMEHYGIKQLSAMNPGSLQLWPLQQQEPLFRLLAPLPETLGVVLLPSFMMQPEHSISGIFFQTETKYYNCSLCPMADCPNRKAPSTVV